MEKKRISSADIVDVEQIHSRISPKRSGNGLRNPDYGSRKGPDVSAQEMTFELKEKLSLIVRLLHEC